VCVGMEEEGSDCFFVDPPSLGYEQH
jgi:hypothetical protein